jgi:DNA-binding CsgD family transcriptional regulator
MANGRKTDQQRLTAQERRIKVLSLRKAGVSFRAIAETLGCSIATVHGDVQHVYAELNAQQQAEAQELRTLEAARLDDLQAGCWSRARNGDLKAIQTALRIMERRARLLGLDLQPGMALPADMEIILRWHDGDRDIIDITPTDGNHAAAAPQIAESGGAAPGALPYRVLWSEMGQEPACGDAEPADGAE